MDDKRERNDGEAAFDLEWDALNFSSARVHDARIDSSNLDSIDDWEERYSVDTTGYVADPATTSFTDIDLSEAQLTIRDNPEWAGLDSWSDA